MSIWQAQERSVEVGTTAEDSRDSSHREAAQWELEPVSSVRQDQEPLFPGWMEEGLGLDPGL